MLDSIGAIFVRVYANTRDFERQVRKAADRGTTRFDNMVNGWQKRLRRAGTGGWFDTMTSGLAGMLGVARSLGGATFGLVEKLGKGIEGAGNKLEVFGNKFASLFGGQFAGMLAGSSKMLQSLGSSIAALASNPYTAIAAIVAAVGALQMALGVVVVVANAAVAGMVALGSAIYYTVAASALLVPLIVALGLGFAGMVLGGLDAAKAIGALNKAMNESDPKKRAEAWKAYNKELAKLGPNAREAVKAFKPILESFKGFKKLAGEALFDGMASALKKAQPLITAVQNGLVLMAGAMGNVIDGFLKLGQDTAFLKSLNALFASSAKILTSMGTAFTQTFAGLTGFFSAVAPIAEKFATALAGMATKFNEWANSAAGQTAITEFFTTAYEMAGKVWEVVKNVALALHELFTAGATQEAAGGLFDWLILKVQEFREWIKTAAADGTLEAWFNNAKQIGIALWGVLVSIGNFLKALNTPENVAWAVSILKYIGAMIDLFGMLFSIGAFVFKGLAAPIKRIIDLMVSLVGWIKSVIDWFKRIVVPKLPTWLPGTQAGERSARGLTATGLMTAQRSSVVTNNWNIVTPSADSRVVAAQVMNRAVAMAG